MNDLSYVPQEKLRRLIAETEDTLAELKSEMDRRDEAAQHREIDRLDEHMKNAELSLATIRDFFRYLVGEVRGRDQS